MIVQQLNSRRGISTRDSPTARRSSAACEPRSALAIVAQVIQLESIVSFHSPPTFSAENEPPRQPSLYSM